MLADPDCDWVDRAPVVVLAGSATVGVGDLPGVLLLFPPDWAYTLTEAIATTSAHVMTIVFIR